MSLRCQVIDRSQAPFFVTVPGDLIGNCGQNIGPFIFWLINCVLLPELMMDVCSILELIGTGGRCTIRFCMFELWPHWEIARLSQQIFKCNDILLWLPQSMWLDHGNMPHVHNDILLISLLPPCVNNFVPIMQSYHAVAIPTIDINPLTDGSFKF